MTVLAKYYSNLEDELARKEHCNHFGHLANDPESSIAMTGCPGREKVAITLLSKHLQGSPLIDWHLNGTIERVEIPIFVSFIVKATIVLRHFEINF